MRRGVRDIQEERAVGMLLRVFPNPIGRVIVVGVRCVEIRGRGRPELVLEHHLPAAPGLAQQFEERGGSADQTEVPVEAPAVGPVLGKIAHVPLARHVGPIPGAAQHFGDRGALRG